MDEVEGSGGGAIRLGKKQGDKGGEVDYRTKAGTAWSHSYLNQKPWHPLSYPNQRRKWIAEQTHANRERRAEEVAREFAQEQEFFRQTALFTKKEKEKVEMMKAVSFMYVRPPGYSAESAKAAEVADERKNLDQNNVRDPTSAEGIGSKSDKNVPRLEIKARPKDVFGRPLPTEEEFGVLKNAPRLETGMPARVKPFGVEIRNVRCVRCGAFGHQSGDRECPLKDAIMPNEESRLKRDDPLTAIMAQTDSSEPLKWELKQKPGLSPPRGGFQPDDPNQQIVAEEIFDEYGGFLGDGAIPALISNFSTKKPKKHSKHKSRHKKHHSPSGTRKETRHHRDVQSASSSDSEDNRERKKSKHKKKKTHHSESESEDDRDKKRRASSKHEKRKSDHAESSRQGNSESEHHRDMPSSSDSNDTGRRKRRSRRRHEQHTKRYRHEVSRPDSSDSEEHHAHRHSSDSESDRERKRRAKGKHRERRKDRLDDRSESDWHPRSRRH